MDIVLHCLIFNWSKCTSTPRGIVYLIIPTVPWPTQNHAEKEDNIWLFWNTFVYEPKWLKYLIVYNMKLETPVYQFVSYLNELYLSLLFVVVQ